MDGVSFLTQRNLCYLNKRMEENYLQDETQLINTQHTAPEMYFPSLHVHAIYFRMILSVNLKTITQTGAT